jgi:excisionase family DNA binding protein
MKQRILSLSDVADILGVSRETARRWATSKLIPAFKIHSRGRWQFYSTEVDKFLQQRQSDGRPEQGQGAN